MIISILVAILAAAALVIALVIFRSLQTARRQKSVIEKQKTLVEEKNKEIVDSITYARRLQEAILPAESFWMSHLGQSFILYKPKDIVAGDFYWMETSGDLVLFAVADCTGHGVPGAMVSVVCSTALTRAVKEFHLTDPGMILDKVCELVLATFEKSENNVNDGMDISLCARNTKTGEFKFAGANNSALLIDQNGEVSELKATKQPVGKYDQRTPFSTITASISAGTMLYLYSDGYADQFGGPKGKKFMHKKLVEKLQAIHAMTADEQERELLATFENWRGNLEQVDDVCVSGIRFI